MSRFIEELNWFYKKVVDKMSTPKNLRKDHWSNDPMTGLMSGLQMEVLELEDAMRYKTPVEIIDECCDVAAFAMMVADKARTSIGIPLEEV